MFTNGFKSIFLSIYKVATKEERSSGCVPSGEDLQFGHPSFLLELWGPFEPFLRSSYCLERALIPCFWLAHSQVPFIPGYVS